MTRKSSVITMAQMSENYSQLTFAPLVQRQRPSSKKQVKQKYESDKLIKRLRHYTGKAIADFNMIEEGDTVMVCLSGGKDSFCLLDLLIALQKSAPITFKIIAVNVDQKQPGFPEHILPNYLEEIGVEYRIVEQDTYSIVKRLVPEGKTTCSLCSRLRRGIIYKTAQEIGATKIALGHHRDDVIETLMLNMFFGGKLKAMPPKLLSDDGAQIVIRPLAYCKESDLIEYSQLRNFPIIPCNLCGSQPNLKRKKLKEMIEQWDRLFPGACDNMMEAVKHVIPSHLADTELFDFKNLYTRTGSDS